MNDTVISVERISKLYRLGEVGTGTLSHDLNRWWHKVRGREDPYLKIGRTNDLMANGDSDYVWALKDINFQVKRGEVLGIIGSNGAGKSTLLKILSRVTTPTEGEIKVKGRIASLLEVGTGFNPELTGRDNIYLNGAILGMRKREIASKFDEIVAFAEVERYIDTPVKRYSSGMYVRLAFAVAAHLEPEILIVDEVLAVGDVEFQKRCLGKMQDVAKGGRTVLFVSHNMEAIDRLTSRCLSLRTGLLSLDGKTSEVVADYLRHGARSDNGLAPFRVAAIPDTVTFAELWVETLFGGKTTTCRQGEPFRIVLRIKSAEQLKCDFAIVIENSQQQALYTTHLSDLSEMITTENSHLLTAEYKNPMLRKGDYFVSVAAFSPDRQMIYDAVHHFPLFQIAGTRDTNFPDDIRWGNLYVPIDWKVVN